MKHPIRILIPLFGAVLVLPLARADDRDGHPPHLRVLADANGPDGPNEHHFLMEHSGEKESVAFLGVETTPVPSVVTAQLGLPKGAGLVIRHVVAKSPAAGVLEVNDVLLKLDDQILIEPRQFAVLVRTHKEGDEVTVTYYRAGKETTAKVKLGKHDVPKLAMVLPEAGDRGMVNVQVRHEHGGSPQEMDRVLALLDPEADGRPGPEGMATVSPDIRVMTVDPEVTKLTVNPGNSNMVYTDESGSLALTIKDGKKTLVAKNAKGESLYSGPIDTPEQRKGLSPEVRQRLEKIEGMDGFSFQTDGDFRANVKYVRAGTKISLPLPEAAGDEAPEALRELVPPAY